ncbi:MAG TPA: ABC transporter permease [Thermoleophilia bacterium]|nr:ABC transporter permease [Thermoleophilia bacterium]
MPPLLKLILIRVGLGILTLFLVSVVVFAATQALPGDTARAILGKEAANVDRYEALREQLGLNEPIAQQYLGWLGGVVTGDLGNSLVQDEPVTELLSRRVQNTAVLVFLAALVSIPLSLLLGSITALRRDSKFDVSVSIGSLSLAALPEFVIGIVLVLLFATQIFNWLPAVSRVDPDVPIYQQLELFILPALTLTLAVAPYITRILRASTIEVLESEYVMMARLKGLPERLVLNRHAVPNALAPALQVTALNLAWLAGGVVVVEYLFAFPGIGSALVDAVANRDMPMVQAICILIAAVYVLANLTADILTILVSPRLRTGLR